MAVPRIGSVIYAVSRERRQTAFQGCGAVIVSIRKLKPLGGLYCAQNLRQDVTVLATVAQNLNIRNAMAKTKKIQIRIDTDTLDAFDQVVGEGNRSKSIINLMKKIIYGKDRSNGRDYINR